MTTKIITREIITKSSFRIQILHDIYQPEKQTHTKKTNLTLHASTKKISSPFHQLLFTSWVLMKIMWLEVVTHIKVKVYTDTIAIITNIMFMM